MFYKTLKITVLLGIILGFFAMTRPIYAQSCNADFAGPLLRENGGMVCVGGFSTTQELYNQRLEIWCDRASLTEDPNSATVACGAGQDIQTILGLSSPRLVSFDLQGSQVGTAANGTYYTCYSWNQINPRIHAITVNVVNKSTNQQACSTGTVYVSSGLGPTCPDGKSINTALGCINVSDFGSLISDLLKLAIGIGGGLTLLLMGYGVFIITTSSGIPDKINEGQNIITAAAGGLLFVVLSVVLFRLIGVNILQLPGL